MRIKKNDQVQIISGKDRGKRGKVLRVNLKSKRVLVEGLNLVKRHKKPRKSGEKGQIVEIPAFLPMSKVMLVCSVCGKSSRIIHKVTQEGKSRICKKCKNEIK